MAARAKPELEETAQQIARHGGRAVAVPTDVTLVPDGRAADDADGEVLGGLDIVVNNAGIARVAPLAEASLEDWRSIIDVNLSGVFHGCRAAAAPYLIRQRAGKVINLASVLAAVALPGYTCTRRPRAASIALTRTLAVEWARHNIQVNAIAPGWFVDRDERGRIRRPSDSRATDPGHPGPAYRSARGVGPLAVYLASSGSDFMTGQTIFLDGGHTRRNGPDLKRSRPDKT